MTQKNENSLWNYSENPDNKWFWEKNLNESILNSIHQYSWILETFKNVDGLVMEESVYSGGGNKF